jgi:hypothetical protein
MVRIIGGLSEAPLLWPHPPTLGHRGSHHVATRVYTPLVATHSYPLSPEAFTTCGDRDMSSGVVAEPVSLSRCDRGRHNSRRWRLRSGLHSFPQGYDAGGRRHMMMRPDMTVMIRIITSVKRRSSSCASI